MCCRTRSRSTTFAKLDRPPGEKTFIFFGRLHESKGLRHIADACQMLSEQGFKFKYVCTEPGPSS